MNEMHEKINVIYLGGPTIILEIGGLRLMTDPTLDPAGETFMIGEKLGYSKTIRSGYIGDRAYRCDTPEP